MSEIFSVIEREREETSKQLTSKLLDPLVQPENYVGEVITLAYDEATVQVHDHYRQKVGGLPSQCFLIATRKRPGDDRDWSDEDTSVILLRVIGPASLPHEAEVLKIRVEATQRTEKEEQNWEENIDLHTRNLLSFAGVRCRVLGTFYVDVDEKDKLVLRFGSDISNYYAALALKVYKPTKEALGIIANYRDATRSVDHPLREKRVEIGRVRYASTDRRSQGIDGVRVSLAPTDLLRQKTALFGMTRTGKSNTTKIIAKTIFELRYEDAKHGRIGQLIFDYNGEYANENVQDKGALKNVWKLHKDGNPEDVVTYGTEPHPNDPERRLMKVNFYADSMLLIGKRIIDAALSNERGNRYIDAFLSASLEPPEPGSDKSKEIRYKRRVLAYRALLAKAGFEVPAGLEPRGEKLFNKDLLEAMRLSHHKEASRFANAADLLEKLNEGKTISWEQAALAFEILHDFITKKDTGYDAFNMHYVTHSSGSGLPWADEDFKGILGMIGQRAGATLVRRVIDRHTATVDKDYADMILEDLHQGRLVIVDQSLGNPELNQVSADRIMKRIFDEHQRIFSSGEVPPDILIYIEEAHNLLPSGKDLDPKDPRSIWPKVTKEGAKLRIGLIYATQEVSSIHKSVLKNTANWFIGHLNNTEETRELVKFYDFADFEPSILRAQDPGFIRMKTLSNSYVVPIQVDRFRVEEIEDAARR